MSREDAELAPVAVLRRWIDAWNRADLEAFAGAFDAEAVVITDPSWVEAGPFEGRAAIGEWYAGLRESWGERNAVVIAELFEAGENAVLRINWEVRGRSSGIDTTLDATCVNRINGEKIIRQQWYFDHDEALRAAGLPD